jgi:hypothetical protein
VTPSYALAYRSWDQAAFDDSVGNGMMLPRCVVRLAGSSML